MRSLLAISLILVCCVDKSYETFAEFMNNLPSEIANAFSTAWLSITDAIKKPVRIKRIGHGGKLKTTVKVKTTTSSYETNAYFHPTSASPSEDAPTARDGNRVTIPVFPTPRFKTLDDWRSMQKAYYAKKKIDTQSKYNANKTILPFTKEQKTSVKPNVV